MSEQDNVIKVFNYALNQEKTGLAFFQSNIERLDNSAAADAFRKLVGEEEKHIAFINRILEDLKTHGRLDEAAVESVAVEPSDYFRQRAKDEFMDESVIESMLPDVTVFNVAWLIEKDLSEFYANAARQTEGPTAKALGMLSEWEKTHERFFRDYRDQLTQKYAQMPWGG
jgi:rubrerythrin